MHTDVTRLEIWEWSDYTLYGEQRSASGSSKINSKTMELLYHQLFVK